MKASINGPNRRKNKTGDKTTAFDLWNLTNSTSSKVDNNDTSQELEFSNKFTIPLKFKVKSLEKFLEKCHQNDQISKHNKQNINKECLGDACVFTIRTETSSVDSNPNRQISSPGKELLKQYFHMSKYEC